MRRTQMPRSHLPTCVNCMRPFLAVVRDRVNGERKTRVPSRFGAENHLGLLGNRGYGQPSLGVISRCFLAGDSKSKNENRRILTGNLSRNLSAAKRETSRLRHASWPADL